MTNSGRMERIMKKIKDELIRSNIDKIEFSKPYSFNGDSIDFRFGYIRSLTDLGILDGLSAMRICNKILKMEGWEKESEDVFYKEIWTRQDVVEALKEENVETSCGNIDKMMSVARETFEELELSDRNELLCSLVMETFK